jgi:DNA-binding IscR family transcriptional regulator
MLAATSEYALRALVLLSQLPADTLVKTRALSVNCSIPAQYLLKAMLALRSAGFIEGIRGFAGRLQTDHARRSDPIIKP